MVAICALACAACGGPAASDPGDTAKPGIVFTFPANHQVDVPVGANVVVTFSEAISPGALASCTLSGPSGPVAGATATATAAGTGILFSAPPLDPGTTYTVSVPAAIDPQAQNLPSGPVLSFTTRSDRPRAAAPALVAVNGGDPSNPESFRPMLDTSTIRLLFSEPLDPRTIAYGPNALELVDSTGSDVPATVVSDGIHVSIDPVADLTGGSTYTLQVGGSLLDLGGQAIVPASIPLTARDTKGSSGGATQTLRTLTADDPPIPSRGGGSANQVVIDKPLIGVQTQIVQPSALASELGDPAALAGPIAFTIRKGQRLTLSGLDVALGGQIPVGVTTGDITIEFLTDGGGRIFRNPNQDPTQTPEDPDAPLYADLSFDIAVYGTDATGTAVLTQTVLGVQAVGTVTIANGQLAIETVSAMELGLLGVTSAPSNLVLALTTDPSATAPTDTDAPQLITTFPPAATNELPVDAGIDLIFSEPVDLDRLRAGGLALTSNGTAIDTILESHGASVVVRPIAPLAYSASYQLALTDVADLAGNPMAAQAAPLSFSTPPLASTDSPVTVAAVYPGVPCALTAATGGHCAGGQGSDDAYGAFTLPADQDLVVVFTQPPTASTIALGSACDTGSVRVEQVDASGACSQTVPGTLERHDHDLRFIPDAPWTPGTSYRLTLVSGSNKNCDAGEICGMNGDAASFDPLNGTQGTGASGGPNLAISFVGAMPDGQTFLLTGAAPFADINGDGQVDGAEAINDANRAGLTITGTTGAISDAKFNSPRCPDGTPAGASCMYLDGAMPTEMGDVQMSCAMPDGTTADACVPVTLTPQAMYATSISMSATVGISISTDTGTSVMRIREPTGGGPIVGYIATGSDGTPQLELALDLYMDAPDMSITLSSHDLHSKPLSVLLIGPVQFLADGRIAIAAANVADVPVTVNISAPLGIKGAVDMVLPAGQMKLQLVSPALRGVAP
nr:Ig-like domain-containing protein [Kofleriaceae bacterium]